jgi:hypothetical protein
MRTLGCMLLELEDWHGAVEVLTLLALLVKKSTKTDTCGAAWRRMLAGLRVGSRSSRRCAARADAESGDALWGVH